MKKQITKAELIKTLKVYRDTYANIHKSGKLNNHWLEDESLAAVAAKAETYNHIIELIKRLK